MRTGCLTLSIRIRLDSTTEAAIESPRPEVNTRDRVEGAVSLDVRLRKKHLWTIRDNKAGMLPLPTLPTRQSPASYQIGQRQSMLSRLTGGRSTPECVISRIRRQTIRNDPAEASPNRK